MQMTIYKIVSSERNCSSCSKLAQKICNWSNVSKGRKSVISPKVVLKHLRGCCLSKHMGPKRMHDFKYFSWFKRKTLNRSTQMVHGGLNQGTIASNHVVLFRWRYKIWCVSWFKDGRSQTSLNLKYREPSAVNG